MMNSAVRFFNSFGSAIGGNNATSASICQFNKFIACGQTNG